MDYRKIIELVLESHDKNMIVIDENYLIRYADPGINEVVDWSGDFLGENIFKVFEGLKKEESLIYNTMVTGQPIIGDRKVFLGKDSVLEEFKISTIPMLENDNIFGIIIIFRKLKKAVKTLANKNIYSNGTSYTLKDILGESKQMRKLKERILKITNSSSPVFVYGETGTGKELVVQSIHNTSQRKDKPFIAQNCAALPENLLESILFGTVEGSFTGARDKPGLFEMADGGTLFLDEINSMDINLQSKLLRVIEDGVIRRLGGTETKIVDVRIIAASNTCPLKLVEENLLREDLYYRLNVIYFQVPPLRERKEDMILLSEKFIKDNNLKMNKNIKGLEKEVIDQFLSYYWPGNVRELENIIESSMNFVEGNYIKIEDINLNKEMNFRSYRSSEEKLGLNSLLENYEKGLIEDALYKADNNCAQAARDLKIPKQTLYSKLKRFKIKY